MESWKEHSHLLANGAFQAKCSHTHGNDILNLKKDFGLAVKPNALKDCTLIARRIEDMDSEELLETHYIADSHADVNEYDEDEWRQVLTQWADLDDLSFATARQLLSLGVYPGPQSHFRLPDSHRSKVINADRI